ncbi:NAD(P)-dependent oxidoreductase [Novosphingobium piscinae]|uniref:precorrin-2 dehydrogenase n=1 Tax=Novosphingobium piscinae TaxID=1507448 RepID=A0A7X1FWW2_9SPHN|nr:bifunctional precorrin-2 dehydrogenase/sirohydrochlorin ferrochelatase [Novosphingobium piscinae]MBC2668464.1 siroheme synthase [Novosphingobium piscinae]
MDSLPLYHRISGQPVIVLGHGEAAEAKARLVRRAGGEVIDDLQDGIDRGARLAFIAHDDARAAEGDALRARCAGLLVNVVDRPALCDFTTPSLLERGPVLVAVATGGVSAGLAKALRLRLEGLLPSSLADLARGLGDLRDRLKARFPGPGDRRRALDAALAAGGPLDPLDPASAARLVDWAEGAEPMATAAAEIRLRSADPDDLTLRDARLLGAADCVAHEPDVAEAVLLRARADAVRWPLAPGEPAPVRDGLVVTVRAGR